MIKQFNSIFNFTFSDSGLKTIIWSGLVAGILDSVAGVLVYYVYFGLNPLQVLQFIASGIYGPEAIDGGVSMIFVGLFFHFLIAYTCAILYFFAYPRIKILSKNEKLMGLVFGAAIWLVMNLGVLPASNVAEIPFDPGLVTIGIIWHMILVGLPIAMISGLYFRQLQDIKKPLPA